MRVDFDGCDGRACAREPQCQVPAQGPDFEHGFGTDEAALDGEVLALE